LKPDRINKRRLGKRKRTMNFGTWNIKGLRTKQKEVIDEVKRFQMDIVALTETKKKGKGSELIDEYIHLYSGVNKGSRAKAGVSLLIKKNLSKNIKDWKAINERIITVELLIKGYEIVIIGVYAPSNDDAVEAKDDHDENLSHLLDTISNRKEILLLGDFNGHTGSKTNDVIVGPHGENDVNDNGERLIDVCQQHSLRIQNGFYKHKDIHKYTWTQPTLQRKSIIDYIITRQISRIRLQDVRVYRGAECGTDHHLVKAKVYFPLIMNTANQPSTNHREVHEVRYNLDSLKNDSTVFLYRTRLNLKLNTVAYSSGINTYQNIIECIQEAAREALGEQQQQCKKNANEWWNEDIETMVAEKKTCI